MIVSVRLLGIALLLATCVSPSSSVAQSRSSCGDGAKPQGVVVSVSGNVSVREFSGMVLPITVGNILCAQDEITTGERSRIEFRLSGKDTTTGSSSNSVTIIPSDQSGCVEIRNGVLRFISSIIGYQCFSTPLIDGGIDGTEALIVVDGQTGDSFVLVREGIFTVSDRRSAAQKIRLDATSIGERPAAFATQSQRLVLATPENVPAKFRDFVLRPENATDWAVHYPPVLLAAGITDPTIRRAAALLDAGQPDAVDTILANGSFNSRNAAAALSLRAVAAIFRGQNDEGTALANEAVAIGRGFAAAYIAQSYARQANGDVEAALESAEAAVDTDPQDAFAWARLAELYLTVGVRGAGAGGRSDPIRFGENRLRRAVEAVAKSSSSGAWSSAAVNSESEGGSILDLLSGIKVTTGARRRAVDSIERSLLLKETSLARTIEGFAALATNDFEKADKAFRRAIEIDSTAPLPRLGLGLHLIRQGKIAQGRLEIETAVALDPRRASLRTWLGRAYLEEGRAEKATAQLAIAQEEDPDDPNAYLFDAMRLFRENRPVEALRAIETAQAQGGSRSVLRSEAGLGEDSAVRSAATGRIFDVLGFETLLGITAGNAVDQDPGNPEAHRLLADAARTDPDRETTRVSELLKANLLSGPSKAPIQPQLGEIDLALLDTAGPARVTFAEFAPLFESNGFRADASGFFGTQDTRGYEASVTALYDNLSIGGGGFYYRTDGFGINNEIQHEIYSAQIKYQPIPELTLFAEIGSLESNGGDRRIETSPRRPRSPNLEVAQDNLQFRFGAHGMLSDSVSIIGYFEAAELKTSFTESAFFLTNSFEGDQDGYKVEVLGLVDLKPINLQIGAEYMQIENDDSLMTSFFGFPLPTLGFDGSIEFWRVYGSADFEFPENAFWTIGVAYESFEQKGGVGPLTKNTIQPKVGLRVEPFDGVTLRTAYSESLTRPSLFPETLERTTLASFDQFFEDGTGVEFRTVSGGVDLGPFYGVRAGAIAEAQKIVLPNLGLGASRVEAFTLAGYISAEIGDQFAVTFEPEWEQSKSTAFFQAAELDTILLPVTGSFFHPSGFFASSTVTWFNQKGIDAGIAFSDSGFVADASMGFRLPNGRGAISVEALNLFDTEINLISRDSSVGPLNFGDVLFTTPLFAPDLSILATLTLRL